VQVGDDLSFGSVDRVVAKVAENAITLDAAMPTYSGPVTGTSAIVSTYQTLNTRLLFFLKRWKSTVYTQNLSVLDRVLAPLGASSTPGQRNMALAEITKLETELSALLAVVADPTTSLPEGAAQEERGVVSGILTTLLERNYDRAADLLLKCDISALLEIDADSASYSGNFLKASSQFAQANFSSPSLESEEPASSAGHN